MTRLAAAAASAHAPPISAMLRGASRRFSEVSFMHETGLAPAQLHATRARSGSGDCSARPLQLIDGRAHLRSERLRGRGWALMHAQQHDFGRCRVCPAERMRAPIASMMVRAFSTSCALLAYTPRLKYRLSSRPTRTLPPRSTDCATHGICMRLTANEVQRQSDGRVFTMASRWPTSAGTP